MSYDALANGLVLLFLKRAGDRITNVESLQIIEVVTKKVVQALKRGFIKKKRNYPGGVENQKQNPLNSRSKMIRQTCFSG